jgi:hypothetical protein
METFYDELKNKLKVGHFTEYSQSAIEQDFYVAAFISNIQSIIISDLKDEIAQKTKQRKYDYKVNNNLIYGFLKNRIVTLLFSEKDISKVTKELKTLFKDNLIPVRPYRTNKRNKNRRAIKRFQVTKNQIDVI